MRGSLLTFVQTLSPGFLLLVLHIISPHSLLLFLHFFLPNFLQIFLHSILTTFWLFYDFCLHLQAFVSSWLLLSSLLPCLVRAALWHSLYTRTLQVCKYSPFYFIVTCLPTLLSISLLLLRTLLIAWFFATLFNHFLPIFCYSSYIIFAKFRATFTILLCLVPANLYAILS